MPILCRTLVFSAVVLSGAHAYGFAALVQTTATTALGEPAGIYLQIVDLQNGTAVPGALALPGSHTYHAPRYGPGTLHGLITVGPSLQVPAASRKARSFIAGFQASPLKSISNNFLDSDRTWIPRNTLLIRDASGRERVAVLEESAMPDLERPGRLSLFHADLAAGIFTRIDSPYLLPGVPIDAVPIAGRRKLAILCADPRTGAALLSVCALEPEERGENTRTLRVAEDQFGSTPVALSSADLGRRVVALTIGYETQRRSGLLSSWLHVLDPLTLEEDPPFPLPGTANTADRPLRVGERGSLWIATRSPGVEFAYASRVTFDEGRPTLASQIPFTGVDRALQIAPQPGGAAVAIAIDDRMELWQSGAPPGVERQYPAPVGVVAWTPRGILLGEGGRLHLLNTTLATVKQAQLQTGLVTEVQMLPAPDAPDRDNDGLSGREERRLQTNTDDPDTDDDGIPDGVDPEPLRASPRLELPAGITLDGDAAGFQEIALVPENPRTGGWDIAYDRHAMSWLDLQTGETALDGTRTTLKLEPARYRTARNSWLSGTLRVEQRGAILDSEAAGSPARIRVDVRPSQRVVPRILWVWPDDGNAAPARTHSPYATLTRQLAAPPAHFSHDELRGPIEESLEPYAVVVLGVAAALEGVLTRQIVLDYVAQGGSLLFIGAHAPDSDSNRIARWLAPAGITIDTATEANGMFAKVGTHELIRHWNRLRIRGGCLIQTNAEVKRLVVESDSGATGLAVRQYGFGRIAVLASGVPLTDAALADPKHTRFTQDLFRWLASGRYATRDRDMDALPDYVEDANGNGVADSGETNLFNADTDGDHLPDGLEDSDGNGKVDEGETNPRNADTDADGIRDGADAYPLPERGQPQISGFEPQRGPAEGGTAVEIHGLNFPPRLAVWFGERRSKDVRRIDAQRIVAVTPPAPVLAPDARVPVRMTNRPRALEANAPMTFQYTERSHVRLALDILRVARRSYDTYAGTVALVLDAPGVNIGTAAFSIDLSPGHLVDHLNVIPSASLRGMGRELVAERVARGGVRVTLPQGAALTGRVQLGTLQWTVRPRAGQERLTFSIHRHFVTERSGGTATAEARRLQINVVEESRRRRL